MMTVECQAQNETRSRNQTRILSMKKIAFSFLIAFMAFTGGCIAHEILIDRRFFDLEQGQAITASQVLPKLKEKRIILVGEHHTRKSHHQAQLQVIRLLHEAGNQVVIGLEMFRSDNQKVLNRWISGDIDETAFQKIYYDNWTFAWSLYGMIFEYARDEKIPLVGLNVPRDITRQVARDGFNSLSDEQKAKLSHITCRVDKEYMDYIRKAFGGHAHGNLNFNYFCEAQLVWDNAMAVSALDYLTTNPNAVMVILAGTGHVRKQAIPAQISKRSDIPYAVMLPEVPGSIERLTIGSEDADFIILDPS
jgi:uncharacterized iron-regulated protein